jgi:GGDEF domain-containing protein
LRAGAWACLGEPLDAEELVAMLGVYVPAKLEADHARATGLVDESTGVYNARGLKRRAEELAAHAARSHGALGCVLLAADTESGSPPLALMRRIAAALRSTARQSDAIGRVGESAFAVVAVDTDAAQARRLAQRLAAAILAEPASVGAPVMALQHFRVRAGFDGVPDFHTASIDSGELMLRATAALYRARSDSPEGWIQGYEDGSSAG